MRSLTQEDKNYTLSCVRVFLQWRLLNSRHIFFIFASFIHKLKQSRK